MINCQAYSKILSDTELNKIEHQFRKLFKQLSKEYPGLWFVHVTDNTIKARD